MQYIGSFTHEPPVVKKWTLLVGEKTHQFSSNGLKQNYRLEYLVNPSFFHRIDIKLEKCTDNYSISYLI